MRSYVGSIVRERTSRKRYAKQRLRRFKAGYRNRNTNALQIERANQQLGLLID